jgi:serine phosphatase RsbU (regulator of sigma subunit)
MWLALSLAIALVVFAFDYLTGAEISFSVFYLAPIVLATWFVAARAGYFFAFLSLAAWIVDYMHSGRAYSHPSIVYWNAAGEAGVFLTVAAVVRRVRSGVERQRRLTRRLQAGFERQRRLALRLRASYVSLDRELRTIGDIQKSLLPAALPEVPGYRLAVHYATSARSGGDYYDFFPLPDGRLGLLIADASGHSSPAAVVMAILRALMHTAPELSAPPDEVLAAVNGRLVRNVLPGQFATACYAVLDPAAHALEYSLAGHNPPLVVREAVDGVEEFTNSSGPPLGIFERCPFSRHGLRLGSGGTILFYTDGLTEARDAEGRFFGEERVRELLARHRRAGPEVIRDRLLAAAREFTGGAPPADDLTMVLLRAL